MYGDPLGPARHASYPKHMRSKDTLTEPRPHCAREIWKRQLFVLVRTENILENEAFRKRWRRENHMISFTEFTSNLNPKWSLIAVFLNSFGVV